MSGALDAFYTALLDALPGALLAAGLPDVKISDGDMTTVEGADEMLLIGGAESAGDNEPDFGGERTEHWVTRIGVVIRDPSVSGRFDPLRARAQAVLDVVEGPVDHMAEGPVQGALPTQRLEGQVAGERPVPRVEPAAPQRPVDRRPRPGAVGVDRPHDAQRDRPGVVRGRAGGASGAHDRRLPLTLHEALTRIGRPPAGSR